MNSEYQYDPRTLHPVLAGLTAGAVGGIAGSVVSLSITTPDEIIANTLSITLVALVIGAASGELWRRVRATSNGLRTFSLTVFAAFVLSILVLITVDRLALQNLVGYAVTVAGIVFLSVGLLTPAFSRAVVSGWLVLIPVVLALVVGIALFGRGKAESGELSFEDVGEAATTTTATTVPVAADGASTTAQTDETRGDATTTTDASNTVAIPGDLAAEYTVVEGVATYTVPETLRGLQGEAVGRTESVTGTFDPMGSVSITVDMLAFESDQLRRDSRVRDMFAAAPEAVFTTESLTLPAEVETDEIVVLTIDGAFTINNVTNDVTWTAEARVVESAVELLAELDIVLTDYDITPPAVGGIVQVEDEARLEIAIRGEPSS